LQCLIEGVSPIRSFPVLAHHVNPGTEQKRP
jgi:hypothetical protein